MMVTNDKYELPLIVTESARELANFAGVGICTIHSSVYHAKTRNQKFSRYVRVELEDDDETQAD